MTGFSWAGTFEIFIALCAFAMMRHIAGAVWAAWMKWLLRRSARLRLTVAASIASDKELGLWVGREADEIEATR